MTPFQQFRLWGRRAPVVERVLAALTAVLLVSGLAWAAAPSASHSSEAATGGAGSLYSSGASPSTGGGTAAGPSQASGINTGQPSAAGTGSGSGAPGAAGVAGAVPASPGLSSEGSTGAASPTIVSSGGGGAGPAPSSPASGKPSGCVSPPGTDTGVSGDQIKIAIILVNAFGAAGNSTFGIATSDQQQAYYQDVIDSTNASGGVACHHRIVPVYFPTNPIDSSNLQQTCLAIQAAGVFAVVDYGAYFEYPALAECYPNNHIPYFSITLPPQAEQKQLYPYFFSTGSTMELAYHNAVEALNARGFFSPANGFRTLGFVYHDCTPTPIEEMTDWLRQAGVSSSHLVTYDLGCPSGFASPDQIEQAILKFQESGVTNVTQAEASVDFSNFTTVAEQQNFHPKYGLPDDALVALTYGSQHPDYNNIANAIAITGSRFGEEHTPGYTPGSGTVACNTIFAAHGQPPVYQQPLGAGGSACDDLWLLFASIDHAPALQRNALAAGLHAARSVDMSYPYGPNDFSQPGVTTGSEYWRPLQFYTSCDCWRLLLTA